MPAAYYCNMKWTIERVHHLAKMVYGNFVEERILKKVAEMHVHLEKWDKSFLHLDTKHEWAEVERLANEINEMARPLQKMWDFRR